MSQQEEPMSQLSQDDQPDIIMSANTQSTWKSWSELNMEGQGKDINDLFSKLEPVQEEQAEQLFNDVADAVIDVESDENNNDTETESTITIGTKMIQQKSPVFDLVNNISAKLLVFLPSSRTNVTLAQYSLVIDEIKENMKSEFKTYLEKLPTVLEDQSQVLWGKLTTFIDNITPKSGLNINELKEQLDSALNAKMEDLNEKFINIKANVDTHLQDIAKKAISEDATERANDLLNALEKYKNAMDSLNDILLQKELNTDEKKQILSLWNNLLSLDGLIQQYNDSKKVFNIEEFDIIIAYLDDLTMKLQDMKSRFEGRPNKKARSDTAMLEPPASSENKPMFSWLGNFSMGKKGGRNTKKARKLSKKAKKSIIKGNKSKKNRKTKRSKK